MGAWLQEGKIRYREDHVQGFAQRPASLYRPTGRQKFWQIGHRSLNFEANNKGRTWRLLA